MRTRVLQGEFSHHFGQGLGDLTVSFRSATTRSPQLGTGHEPHSMQLRSKSKCYQEPGWQGHRLSTFIAPTKGLQQSSGPGVGDLAQIGLCPNWPELPGQAQSPFWAVSYSVVRPCHDFPHPVHERCHSRCF